MEHSQHEKLKVAVIGGFGQMISPMAKHWDHEYPAKVLCVHDRKTDSHRHEKYRYAWRAHGATLESEVSLVVSPDELDGVFVCCGKNGDDLSIISELVKNLKTKQRRQFICHMSTVSAGFTEAATKFCEHNGVDYVNYPLTGGPIGAQKATMLILASGNPDVYERLTPALKKLGNPKYFGANPSAATEVKLIGQVMVFNGLIGICSAAALHSEYFQNGKVGGQEQSEFFDFLNAGAGGTRQWDVILSSGIRNNIWDAPFALNFGVIDAIYSAKLCLDRGTSYLTVRPLIDLALAFSFVINHVGAGLATHAIVREMISAKAKELDNFIFANSGNPRDLNDCLNKCIESLPVDLRRKVALEVSEGDFQGALKRINYE